MTRRRTTGIEHICDELLLPLLRSGQSPDDFAMVRLIVGDNDDSYTMTLEFPTIKENPLESESIDEIGKKIIGVFTKSLTSEKNANGIWEIKAEL